MKLIPPETWTIRNLPGLSQRVAAAELLARRTARISLEGYTRYLDLGIEPAEHHRLVIGKLEQLDSGKIKRLMIFLPPGSAKSTYTSQLFPAFYLGRHPEHDLIGASHTAELAEKFGRKVRNFVASEEHAILFPECKLAEDNQAVGRWSTNRGGEYFAAGVGGSITGRRADGGIIDDPVRGREDADSETQRNKVWEWYKSDFLTRLKPNAWVVIVMTRWHEDDLAGRLLEDAKHGGDQWDVLSIPAEAEVNDPLGRKLGERLWPQWFTAQMFAQAKRDQRSWSALYQQRPAPDSGGYYKREWFGFYDERPKHLRLVGASDYAVTDGGGDGTEHAVFGIDPQEDIYIIDWWSGHTTPEEWIETQTDMILAYKPLLWAGESGVIRKAIESALTKRMQQRKAYCRLEWLPSITDKASRARSFQALASMGKPQKPKVYLPYGAPWVDQFLHQHLTFPAGKFDDMVDVTSLLGRVIDQTRAAIIPRPSTLSKPRHGTFDWLVAGDVKTKSKYRLK